MATFQSLGELGDYVTANGIEIVDPGIPLTDLTGDHGAQHVWKTQPSVRKVVDFIARQVATIPLHVYDRVSDTDRKRVTGHPLADVLGSPAPRVAPARFWHSIMVDFLTYDRWCVQKVPRLDGGMELVRIPARRFRLIADGLDRVAAVRIWNSDGRSEDHDPAGYLYDAGYSPRGANGVSPMQTLADILAEAREAVAYRRSVWARGARIPAVIERPADAKWEPSARERFINSWRRFTRSGGQEGGTPILEDGMTLKKVDVFSPRDTADLEGRKLTDAEVASAYHVSPELVGAREGTNSNVEAYRQMLYRDSLGPLITLWEQVLNVMLTPDLADGRALYVEANVEAKMRLSFEEQARVLSSAIGAPWMLRSEGRARANLPAIDHADELVVPLNVTVGGLASPRDTAPPPKARGRVLTKARPDDLGTEQDERQAFIGALVDRAERQAAELEATTPGEWIVGQAAREDDLAQVIAGWIYRLAQVGAWEVLAEYNPDSQGWDAEVMMAWLRTAAATYAARIEQGTTEKVEEAAAEEDVPVAMAAVAAGLATAATLHAVTAATEVISFGGMDAARASGLDRKTWRTGGSNPRVTHAAQNGESVDLDDVFTNGLRFPGDSTGDVDETANCHCRLTYS